MNGKDDDWKLCYNLAMKPIVTTSLGMNPNVVLQAQEIARKFGLVYLERGKKSVRSFLTEADAVLVVYQDQLILEQKNGQRLFFHPDTAMLRIKSGRDPLLEMVGEPPKTVLDCTMGLASDSLVLASGGHKVTALESSFWTHFIVSHGLQTGDTGNVLLNQAMRSIQTVCADSLTYLKTQPSKSVDVIYFDPMFSEDIKESLNLAGLEALANPARLTEEVVVEAKRVAREKIILKAHFRDPIFEELGFLRQVRPNQKFHYGQILLGEEK